MRKRILILLLSVSPFITINAQNSISIPNSVKIDSVLKSSLLQSIDTLFTRIDNGTLNNELISNDNTELNIVIFNSLQGVENNQKDSISDLYKKQLINAYLISSDEYFISIAYIGNKINGVPALKAIFNLIAKTENGKWYFSIPLNYYTKNWKTKVVGNITYYYNNKINAVRAALFNQNNSIIAGKLGVKPEKFNFYLCNHYQDILRLLGYEYDFESNGQTRDGYGVEAKTIFSIMHNEDFSHDIFHYYSGKIRTNKRNHTVEEGMAYYWGNAYYTKQNGEMITLKELVLSLKKYLNKNTQTSLLDLFNNNAKIFNELAKEASAKSVISALICEKVERTKGIEGIKKLINCGNGDDNYFKSIGDLIQIDKSNFNKEVTCLLEVYK